MDERRLDRETRRRLLLATAVMALLGEADAGSADPSGAIRVRTGHRGLAGAWAWNPRGPAAWRLAGRLQRHRQP